MALTVDHATRVVTVPQADLSFVSAGLYELDTETFRNLLRDLEDDPANMALPYILLRIVPYTISGTTYAQALFIVNGFSLEFEDGQYTILLKNSNNNFSDVQDGILVRNQVQVIPENSAGLVVAAAAESAADIATAVIDRTSYMRRDNITYDANGFPLAGRERLFVSKAAADAATYGGVGEGETDTYSITATPDGTFPNAPRTFDKVRDV